MTTEEPNKFPGEGGEDTTIDIDAGRLTEDEKWRVMLDLKPL